MFNELYNEFGHLRGKDALTIEDCNYIMSLCNGCLDLRPLSEGDRYTPKLPENLVVRKHLNIMDCDIDSLPKGLVIHGSLSLTDQISRHSLMISLLTVTYI